MPGGLLVKFTMVICALVACIKMEAQTYLGISTNLGNSLKYSPGTSGLKNPASISGNVLLVVNHGLKKKWNLQYGGGLGILGYTLKVVPMDTLSTSDPFVFPEYSTFYVKANLSVGKELLIGRKSLIFTLGGGLTYYYSIFPTTSYNLDVVQNNGTEDKVFFAEITSPARKIVPFGKISAHLKLNRLLMLGLEYSHHFQAVGKGTYEFYHTRTPNFGKISVYQRELNVVFLVKISRSKS